LFYIAYRRPPGRSLLPYTTLFRSGKPAEIDPDWIGATRRSHPEIRIRGGLVSSATSSRRQTSRGTEPGRPIRWRIRASLARCPRSEEHTSELQSRFDLVCRLLLEK